jgi:hypothetical protein
MPYEIPDLWPDAINLNVLSPVAILKRQASQLRHRTKGLLEGKVETENRPTEKRILHRFTIVAPALEGYTHVLFTASHESSFVYPVKVEFYPWQSAAREAFRGGYAMMPGGTDPRAEAVEKSNRVAAGQDEFVECLREVFSSPYTTGVISSLVARINESPSAVAQAGQPEAVGA